MTMRALPYVCAAVLGAGAAIATGCGDRDNLLPATDASALSTDLAAIRAAADARECGPADSALRRARSTVSNLPDSVDARLRRRLTSGLDKLAQRADAECDDAPLTTTTTVPTTTTTEPPPETTSTQTTPPETTPTTEPTDPVVPEPDPVDPGGGQPDPGTTPAVPADPGGAAPTDPALGPGAG